MGSFALEVTEAGPIRSRAGWRRVSVSIRNSRGAISTSPLMTGIVSGGGRGVQPWMECRLFPTVNFETGKTFDARKAGLEAGITNLLGEIIPDGGHLMIDYESGGQEETFAELNLRVPPPATHLGSLMFRAGFRGAFKDWYFSEGGHEGPRKLQANKSPDEIAARRALEEHHRDLEEFMKRPLPNDKSQAAIVNRARTRARELLKDICATR